MDHIGFAQISAADLDEQWNSNVEILRRLIRHCMPQIDIASAGKLCPKAPASSGRIDNPRKRRRICLDEVNPDTVDASYFSDKDTYQRWLKAPILRGKLLLNESQDQWLWNITGQDSLRETDWQLCSQRFFENFGERRDPRRLIFEWIRIACKRMEMKERLSPSGKVERAKDHLTTHLNKTVDEKRVRALPDPVQSANKRVRRDDDCVTHRGIAIELMKHRKHEYMLVLESENHESETHSSTYSLTGIKCRAAGSYLAEHQESEKAGNKLTSPETEQVPEILYAVSEPMNDLPSNMCPRELATPGVNSPFESLSNQPADPVEPLKPSHVGPTNYSLIQEGSTEIPNSPSDDTSKARAIPQKSQETITSNSQISGGNVGGHKASSHAVVQEVEAGGIQSAELARTQIIAEETAGSLQNGCIIGKPSSESKIGLISNTIPHENGMLTLKPQTSLHRKQPPPRLSLHTGVGSIANTTLVIPITPTRVFTPSAIIGRKVIPDGRIRLGASDSLWGSAHHLNGREALEELLRTLWNAPMDPHIIIVSDSKYAVFCVTVWADWWTDNEAIVNEYRWTRDREIITNVLKIVAYRRKVEAVTGFEWYERPPARAVNGFKGTNPDIMW